MITLADREAAKRQAPEAFANYLEEAAHSERFTHPITVDKNVLLDHIENVIAQSRGEVRSANIVKEIL